MLELKEQHKGHSMPITDQIRYFQLKQSLTEAIPKHQATKHASKPPETKGLSALIRLREQRLLEQGEPAEQLPILETLVSQELGQHPSEPNLMSPVNQFQTVPEPEIIR